MIVKRMGKHRNAAQDAVFVAFMERHPIIAKNYLKGDKQAAEEAWKRLSKELNNVGPPLKDTSQWKRVSAPEMTTKTVPLLASP